MQFTLGFGTANQSLLVVPCAAGYNRRDSATYDQDVHVRMKVLTAQEFAAAYGVRDLVRLAEKGEKGRVPEDAIQFLRDAGLPSRIVFHEFVSGSEVTFKQLGQGLVAIVLGGVAVQHVA